MKRSDMILAIASELCFAWEDHSIPFNVSQDIAEVILSRLEREGMRPPIPSVDEAAYIEDGEWSIE